MEEGSEKNKDFPVKILFLPFWSSLTLLIFVFSTVGVMLYVFALLNCPMGVSAKKMLKVRLVAFKF